MSGDFTMWAALAVVKFPQVLLSCDQIRLENTSICFDM